MHRQDAIAVIAPQSEWPQITMSATSSAATAYSIVADTPPGSGPYGRHDVAGVADHEHVARFLLRDELRHEPAGRSTR